MSNIKVNIGGNRLGSGNKMQTSLHDYSRSSHNLTEEFLSSIAPGVLYPFYVNVGMNGDKFQFDLEEAVRTLPTQGPLFGTFKLQLDMFVCPMRLYQGILHNNPIDIGLKMNMVKLPQICLKGRTNDARILKKEYIFQNISNSSLMKYLGISGLPMLTSMGATETNNYTQRKFNAIPTLAYLDIFKNYYSNKQEEWFYQIRPNLTATESMINEWNIKHVNQGSVTNLNFNNWYSPQNITTYGVNVEQKTTTSEIVSGYNCFVELGKQELLKYQTLFKGTLVELAEQELLEVEYLQVEGGIEYANFKVTEKAVEEGVTSFKVLDKAIVYEADLNLQQIGLHEIDDIRNDILSETNLGTARVFDGSDIYECLKTICNGVSETDVRNTFTPYNAYPMNGLIVKTYQSDLFNNWVQTEWIDGDTGINAITTIDTENGLSMDALNLAQKVYNMLNRIATNGGTYEDYLEAVWAEKTIRKAETPMWCGGLSDEVVFDEVIQTTETEKTPLGTLGGRGRAIGKKHGGKFEVRIEEPSFIIGIASITPRLTYSQGNAWYNTELESIADLHKPELDGIGFQNLITEQMAWWDTEITADTHYTPDTRRSAGKQPAWINYMTAYDKCYGDFADDEGKAFMVLNRNYEYKEGTIKDLTTYIDPAKFNYAFAYAKRDAQNFWLNIRTNVIARRKMSAKIIPNL